MLHKHAHSAPQIPLLLILILTTILLASCTSNPRTSAIKQSVQAGASWEEIAGDGFNHLVISRVPSTNIQTLHIYIGGDGRAFQSKLKVSQDPTPKHSLALELMLTDNSPSAFIARPCYFTSRRNDKCNASLWTSARYSPQVINSVVAVIDKLTQRYLQAQITIIGYSGGGVIALLSALHLPRTNTVITIASPLDTRAWTQLHGYTALHESLNPTDISAWPTTLQQIHFSGGADKNVPPSAVKNFRLKLKKLGTTAEFNVLQGYDHSCCWQTFWGEFINSKN